MQMQFRLPDVLRFWIMDFLCKVNHIKQNLYAYSMDLPLEVSFCWLYNLSILFHIYILDESLSKRVMCLLAELYLSMSQPERAIAIINSLEKVIFTKKEGEESSLGDSMTDRQIEEWRLKIALVSISIDKSLDSHHIHHRLMPLVWKL